MVEKKEIYEFVEQMNNQSSDGAQSDVKKCIKNLDLLVENLESKFKNITHIHILSILCDCTVKVDHSEMGLLTYLFTDNVDFRCPAIMKRVLNEINNGHIYNDLFDEALSS